MEQITRKAYAKINLVLDVTGRLPNGYHEVSMVMQNVGIHDTLTFTKRRDEQIVLTTNDGQLPLGEDNLIYKAVLLLRELTGNKDGVTIHLEKRIPVAAGMAGGSTDAAATLLGVNELLGLGLQKKQLQKESVRIGADVPYCVLGKTAHARGIGEKLTEIASPPQAYLVVAKPDINVSTPVVYRALDSLPSYPHPDVEGMIQALEQKDLNALCEKLGNVLELVTAKEYPVIGQIEDVLLKEGAKAAMMSGSGPSVFGIFDTEGQAQTACKALEKAALAKQLFVTTFENGEG